MADVKISGLPASTTPLAGTEVLPVVQSGATKQVSVANLTAGRAVSAASLALTTTPLPVSSGGTGLTAVTAGRVPYGSTATALATSVDGFVFDPTNVRVGIYNTAPAATLDAYGTVRATRRGATSQYVEMFAGAAGSKLNASAGSGTLSFSTNTGTTDMLSIDAVGNATVNVGNLVIGTSGKGIDFSATAGTGTSELLADYEEGTWTPNQGAGLTVVGAFSSSGTYTKIGRVVTVSANYRPATTVAVASGGAAMSTNLPFTGVRNEVGATTNDAQNLVGGCLVAGTNILSTSVIAATANVYWSVTYIV